MSKHTPGPWYIDNQGHIRAADGKGVATAVYGMRRLDCIEANSKLIAAAPDMADALQWATKFLGDNFSDSDMPELAKLRAALAKAGL